jgi:hypothetical protein
MTDKLELPRPIREISYSPLNAGIHISSPEGEGLPSMIFVGNTGLRIDVHSAGGRPGIWEQQFTPENEIAVSSDTRLKYSEIYAHALYNFIEWWKNSDNFDFTKLPRQRFLYGLASNSEIINFRKKLLGGDVYKELTPSQAPELNYSIDLEKLSRDEKLISKLKKMSDRCKKQNYKMQNLVG